MPTTTKRFTAALRAVEQAAASVEFWKDHGRRGDGNDALADSRLKAARRELRRLVIAGGYSESTPDFTK